VAAPAYTNLMSLTWGSWKLTLGMVGM
jgi:hypothetical protein